MSDHELLSKAAKAAGIKLLPDPCGRLRDCTLGDDMRNIYSLPLWNPLTDDGVALRLAVNLDVYEKIEKFYDPDDFISSDEWRKAVAEESVWVLHWYPDTPVGFHRIAASSLDAIKSALEQP